MLTADILRLPPLKIGHNSYSTAFVDACNHHFAIYQVETAPAFWVVELSDDETPVRPARRYHEYSTALDCLVGMANSFLLGREIELPEAEN